MGLKKVIEKVRGALLCCRKGKSKHSLDIGSPTNVRRMDITEGMPNLSEADAKIIREEASNDAIHLLSLQSHPPTQPPSPHLKHTPPSRSPSTSMSPLAPSIRTPSPPLPNPASSNLPTTLPTPPPQKHADASPPTAFRIKTMSVWERTRRLSRGAQSKRSSHRSSTGYLELGGVGVGDGEKVESVDVVVLDGDSETKSVKCVSAKGMGSVEGFEIQGVVGGTGKRNVDAVKKEKVESDGDSSMGVSGSGSDNEGDGLERKLLIKV